MNKRISFDNETKLGYIYVFEKKGKYLIEETEELEVNPFISLDIDKEKRIVGLELFGEEAKTLLNFNKDSFYTKNDSGPTFMISENKKSLSKYSFLGIEFLFTKPDYKGFNGYNIIDLVKYPENEL
ncbi:DUF2283 domain-containing protein [Bacillus sp. REN3]|uniref:DUF2283 domain-containing protein n=1 Tax=Bacillus sp. REN3 TaxID=2802440 RepID=UPI001AEE00E5|nr:DUF2283 domain-containing protein [Bacillus sp. REN3]